MSNVIQGRAPDGTNKDFAVDALGNLALGNPVDNVPAPGNITTQNLVPAGVATAGSAVEFAVAGISTLAFQVTGTYTGALSVQAQVDGATWVTLSGSPLYRPSNGSFNNTVATGFQDIYEVNVAGYTKVRVTALAAVTGTAVITPRLSVAPAPPTVLAVLASPASTTTSSIAKAEDAVHASGDVGIMSLAVRYETNNAAPASGAGDYSLVQVDDLGKTVTMPYAPPVNQEQAITAAMTLVASTAVFAAAGASIRHYVTNLTITNTHATVGTEVDILDGATILDRIYVPALTTKDKIYNVPLKGTANTALNAQNVTTGSNTFVQATGFKAI